MRLLIIALLFAPCLFALDMKDVDRDTCRFARLALLKDDVREHFALRVGDFDSLDQAVCVDVKMDGAEHLLLLRLGVKAAAVLIRNDGKADRAGEHCFFEVERAFNAAALFDDVYVSVACRTGEDELPVRTRLLRCNDGSPQLALAWVSAEQEKLDKGRYVISTRRVLEKTQTGLSLKETTEYLLDGKRVEGGLETRTTALDDKAAGLARGKVTEKPISVATHCSIARRLERDGLNEAALRHAQAALLRAVLDKLAADDTRRLEAQSLASRLQARLRPVQISQK